MSQLGRLNNTHRLVILMALPPIELGEFDHYTLIVEDARAVAEFHINKLGFKPARIQMVNAGSAPDGEYDMLNHILWLPGSDEKVVVVTEGLTEESIFYRYYWTYGAGIHHVAYTVDDIDETLEKLREHGVETTSDNILQDPVSGLKQIFLDREHCGYFIELIERNETSGAGEFVEDNMSALANTMEGYLDEPEVESDDENNPSISISAPVETVQNVMADPFKLPEWTGHRMIRMIDDKLVEARMHGDIDLKIEPDSSGVSYTWSNGEAEKTIRLEISSDGKAVNVSADLSGVTGNGRKKLHEIITIELKVLKALIEGEPEKISKTDYFMLDEWHLEIHQRRGL
ncbi:MAG: VOC family protein [Candidatus Poseidoniales archaeon]|nr:MAG: VOC family protein [Candidatus Poseidoniales archaeon]